MNTARLTLMAALGGLSLAACAADTNTVKTAAGPGGHRPMMPLVKALDANGDGAIDADEIANAPKALKTLDKNGDGKLTRDELMPAWAPGQGKGGPGGGRKGPPAQ